MPMTINTNVASLNAQRFLGQSQGMLGTSLSRLSSGLRINSAADDAAGLAISGRMSAQIRGLNQAVRNANDGISLSQTAEGALTETTAMLQRMRELAVQSMNDTNSASDRANLQKEVDQLRLEIDRIANNTQFNGKNLLDGTFNRQRFQVGANDGQELSLNIASAKSGSLGLSSGTYVTTGNMTDAASGTSSNTLNSIVSTHDSFVLAGALGTETMNLTDNWSAYQIADRVNSSTTDTGVSATARTYAKLYSIDTGVTTTFTIQGKGGTSEGKSVSGTDITDLIASINEHTTDTGIYAYLKGTTELMLYSSEGYSIGVQDFDYGGQTTGSASFVGIDYTGTASTGNVVTLNETDGSSASSDSSFVGGSVIFETTMNNGYFTITAGTQDSTDLFSITSTGESLLAHATTNTVENLDISTRDGARTAIGTVDGALDYIANIRADLGAVQNRFESTIANLQNVSENLSASRSRILDADFATETADMTKSQILIQSGVAMLAQANQLPQQVLSLLG
ncbi:MAG: Flagellin [Candidatus Magnetoglobus multicellularis str. Araruama]|uniref:Flagellin n=1 Tax=Candidatus Magnetoglobus multicellularis str. Araruama TaxID=890399 RepID=A0A1V1PD99_9BACT|nr:MAG: Flagellin [Candidatus Magnetoglobus multicellularis str. Araruama]